MLKREKYRYNHNEYVWEQALFWTELLYQHLVIQKFEHWFIISVFLSNITNEISQRLSVGKLSVRLEQKNIYCWIHWLWAKKICYAIILVIHTYNASDNIFPFKNQNLSCLRTFYSPMSCTFNSPITHFCRCGSME